MFEVISDELLILPAAFLLPCLGYLCGLILAFVLRRSRKVAVTIAIETGVQNASIPILVLQRSFPQPEGDLAAVMPVAAAYFYSIPIICAWAGLVIYGKCTGKDPLIDDAQKHNGEIRSITKDKDIVKETDIETISADINRKHEEIKPTFTGDTITSEL